MKSSQTIGQISLALVKAQRKMGAATKDAKNPFFKSKYADLGSVMEVVKGPLNEEGISIIQPASSEGDVHTVETILVHESGEWISSGAIKLELSKKDMQQLGSGITYARRYSLQSLLSIPAEDDDGEATMERKTKHEVTKPTLVTQTTTTEATTVPNTSEPAKRTFRGRQASTVSTGDNLF